MLGLALGLILAGIAVALTIVLPIVSFLSARQARSIARSLTQRLEALERRVGEIAAEPIRLKPDPTETVESIRLKPDPTETADPIRVKPDPTDAAERIRPTRDLEQLIGGRWLLYAGIAAVILGMSYFVKFAFDNGWVSERLRVAAGTVTGGLLVAGGLRFAARGLQLFGQALAGGGIVVLYVSIYAALHFYALISPTPAFMLMVLVTAGGAWVADRQKSQPLAALALVGGFATPLLVGGERDVQVVLFTYMAILIAGSAVLARRHAWPLLSAASFICTFLLVITWFFASFSPEKWLVTELFLTLYAALFGYLLWALLRSGDRSSAAQVAMATLVTAPLAYHVASLALLNGRPAAWLVYLVLFTLAGLILSHRTGAAWVRLLVLLLVGVPMVPWLEGLPYQRWYGPSVFIVVALYILHLAAQWHAAADDDGDAGSLATEIAHAQLNGLLMPLTLYLFVEDRAAWINTWLMAGLALWNGMLALAARSRLPRLHLQFTALCATLAAIAVALAFDGPVVALGWTAEGVVLGWLALRERSRLVAIGAATLLGLGSAGLLDLLLGPLPAGDTPFLNPRALSSAIAIAMIAWLAARMRGVGDIGRLRDAAVILANVLAVVLLSTEIYAWYGQRALDAFAAGEMRQAASAELAQQVSLSITWAVYAVGLIAFGMRRGYAPARYLGILLFAITVTKILGWDLEGLDRFYRMISVLAVGLLLLAASYLYQRRGAAPGH